MTDWLDAPPPPVADFIMARLSFSAEVNQHHQHVNMWKPEMKKHKY